MKNVIKKKDIEKLDRWGDYNNLEYDSIYIVPTSEKSDWYKLAYYIGKIWDEVKIIDKYDCGSMFLDVQDTKYFMLNWDFEDIYWWIKFWRNNWKLKYEYWGRISIVTK